MEREREIIVLTANIQQMSGKREAVVLFKL